MFVIISTILICFFSLTNTSTDDNLKVPESIELKVGFLVGSQRLTNETAYQRPGRLLFPAFRYGIDSLNKLYSGTRLEDGTQARAKKRIKFTPIIVETFGDEAESIRQTVELITRHRVNFIIGPQETCRVESFLASIYNVAMISHYCNLWPTIRPESGVESDGSRSIFENQASQRARTFVEGKPPPWTIIDRVFQLVDLLLTSSNCYPNRLVLLYRRNKELRASDSSSNSDTDNKPKETLEADRYKFIGESLEIKLRELNRRGSKIGRSKSEMLTVLNWHSTFHYGYTTNPFRQLIRRHLLQNRQTSYQMTQRPGSCRFEMNNYLQWSSLREEGSSEDDSPKLYPSDGRLSASSIYIVVGNYFEHLGLMLALNELNLLSDHIEIDDTSPIFNSSSSKLDQTNRDKLIKQPQSSISINRNSLGDNNCPIDFKSKPSMVIGVDIEQYDDRQDSVRLLRGVLMDQTNAVDHLRQDTKLAPATSDSDLDSVALSYRRYLGVMPTKPTGMDQFLNDMIDYYNQSRSTNDTTSNFLDPSNVVDSFEQSPNSKGSRASLSTVKLLQLVRMPNEAFYLYKSLMHMGTYFADCLLRKNFTLAQCSQGRRVAYWLKRHSEEDATINSKIDDFNIITNRKQSDLNDSTDAFEDIELVTSVASFKQYSNQTYGIQFNLDLSELHTILHPLWCNRRASPGLNSTHCLLFNSTSRDDLNQLIFDKRFTFTSFVLIGLGLSILGGLGTCAAALYLKSVRFKSRSGNGTNDWYNQEDERNLLLIIHELLINQESNLETDSKHHLEHSVDDDTSDTLRVHCYMFSFPSCKFVHWISALHQLKEMLFQYQSLETDKNIYNCESGLFTILPFPIRKFFTLKHAISSDVQVQTQNQYGLSRSRGFFVEVHRFTPSVRILMHKYKSINEVVCKLKQLNDERLIKLKGLMLGYEGYPSERTALLVLEKVSRGNMRIALKRLVDYSLNNERINIYSRLVSNILQDLIDGLIYIHESSIGFHGQLMATNCLITTDWRLKISGFHLFHLRRSLGQYIRSDANRDDYFNELIYSAPEVIENYGNATKIGIQQMRLADVFSFAFIAYELMMFKEPWSVTIQAKSCKLLVERLRDAPNIRPSLDKLEDTNFLKDDDFKMEEFKALINSCWSHADQHRPQSARALKDRYSSCLKQRISPDCLMDVYLKRLEDTSSQDRSSLIKAREENLRLKWDSIPAAIVSNTLNCEDALLSDYCHQRFDSISLCAFRFILTCDDQQIPRQLEEISSQVHSLTSMYQNCLHLIESHVDSALKFVVYSGEFFLQNKHQDLVMNHQQLIASYALQLNDVANRLRIRFKDCLQLRCGLHCGPLNGFLIRRFDNYKIFDESSGQTLGGPDRELMRFIIFGKSLEVANCLEHHGVGQRIQLSTGFRHQLLQSYRNSIRLTSDALAMDRQEYVMIKREGRIQSRTLGDLETYWLLNGPRLTLSQSLLLSSPQ